MLDRLASIGASAQASIAALAILITIAVILRMLRWRRRRTSREVPPQDTHSADVQTGYGAALRENMERMRKDAPFRRH